VGRLTGDQHLVSLLKDVAHHGLLAILLELLILLFHATRAAHRERQPDVRSAPVL